MLHWKEDPDSVEDVGCDADVCLWYGFAASRLSASQAIVGSQLCLVGCRRRPNAGIFIFSHV